MSAHGVRLARHAPLLLVDWDGPALERGTPVLVQSPDGTRLAIVVLAPGEILGSPPEPPAGRIVAARRESLPVAGAIEARRRAALAEAREAAGSDVVLSDVRWSDDLGQLTVRVEGGSEGDDAGLRRRLARHFRAAVKLCHVPASPSSPPG